MDNKISHDRITYIRPLGFGGQSTVFLVSVSGKEYVNKIYNEWEEFQKECMILEILNENRVKNVPKLYGISESPMGDCLLQEYHKDYHPSPYLHNEEELMLFTLNLLSLIKQIHANGIIHQDIKLDNILYNEFTRDFILIDFGGACIEDHECLQMTTLDSLPWDYNHLERDFRTLKRLDYYATAQLIDLLNDDIKSQSIDDTVKLIRRNYRKMDLDEIAL